jgi:hypothetical protein
LLLFLLLFTTGGKQREKGGKAPRHGGGAPRDALVMYSGRCASAVVTLLSLLVSMGAHSTCSATNVDNSA